MLPFLIGNISRNKARDKIGRLLGFLLRAEKAEVEKVDSFQPLPASNSPET